MEGPRPAAWAWGELLWETLCNPTRLEPCTIRWVWGSGNYDSICTINTKVYDARLGAFSSKTQASMKEGVWRVGGQRPAFSPRTLVSGGGRTFRVAASQCLIRDEIRRGDNILLSLLFRDTH